MTDLKPTVVVIMDFSDTDTRDTMNRKWTPGEIAHALNGVSVADKNAVVRKLAKMIGSPCCIVWKNKAGNCIDARNVRPA